MAVPIVERLGCGRGPGRPARAVPAGTASAPRAGAARRPGPRGAPGGPGAVPEVPAGASGASWGRLRSRKPRSPGGPIGAAPLEGPGWSWSACRACRRPPRAVLAPSAGRRGRLGQDARRLGAGAAPAGVAAGLLELLEPPLLVAKSSAEATGGKADASRAIAGAVRDQPATTSGAVAALTALRAALRSRGVRPPHMPSPSAAARHSALTGQPAHSARAAV